MKDFMSHLWKRTVDVVWALFHPSYWFQRRTYSPEWDAYLLWHLEHGDVRRLPISDYKDMEPREDKIRPARRTINRAMRAIMAKKYSIVNDIASSLSADDGKTLGYADRAQAGSSGQIVGIAIGNSMIRTQ